MTALNFTITDFNFTNQYVNMNTKYNIVAVLQDFCMRYSNVFKTMFYAFALWYIIMCFTNILESEFIKSNNSILCKIYKYINKIINETFIDGVGIFVLFEAYYFLSQEVSKTVIDLISIPIYLLMLWYIYVIIRNLYKLLKNTNVDVNTSTNKK
jgi:hypothetical protein